MKPEKRKIFLSFLFGGLGMFVIMFIINGFPRKKCSDITQNNTKKTEILNNNNKISSVDILQFTNAETVISYVKTNRRLPDFYLTKNEARKQGWTASKGNLCDVLPGKAIGGDYFSNREKQLPKDEKYFEADVNYNCGNRNADRIIYTKSGEVYLTTDHYKSFQKQ